MWPRKERKIIPKIVDTTFLLQRASTLLWPKYFNRSMFPVSVAMGPVSVATSSVDTSTDSCPILSTVILNEQFIFHDTILIVTIYLFMYWLWFHLVGGFEVQSDPGQRNFSDSVPHGSRRGLHTEQLSSLYSWAHPSGLRLQVSECWELVGIIPAQINWNYRNLWGTPMQPWKLNFDIQPYLSPLWMIQL